MQIMLRGIHGIGLAASAVLWAASTMALAQGSTEACHASAQERPWLDRSLSPRCRAQAVLRSFRSLDEKVQVLVDDQDALMTSDENYKAKWLTDRGLPTIRGGDGPAGIRGGHAAVTSFPTPLAMAASFDPATAELYGRTLGAEFFDFGLNQMGGPALDVTRTWHFGRSTESLGEDPFLIAAMAGPEIRGIQSQHVRAMAKHFAVYNQEQGRSGDHPMRTTPGIDAIVGERAVRELYLPGFQAAVTVGGVGQVMCAFPRINGIYACENPALLGILKKEWGFDGQVTPDYPTAQHSIVAAVNAGLDYGIFTSRPPNPSLSEPAETDDSFHGESLATAVKQGRIPESRIDDMLLRRLVPDFRIGTFDHPAARVGADVSTPERRAVAAEIVTRGAVLLKNDKGILPFGPRVRSVAVIGAQAGADPVVAEVGSAHVEPFHLSAALPAIRTRGGKTTAVSYSRGTLGLDPLPLLPTGMVKSAEGLAGFKAEYFANPNLDFTGKPFLVRQEAAINNLTLPTAPGYPANRAWSVRWSGRLSALEDGVQKFTLAGSGTARLFIDGKAMGSFENSDFSDTVFASVAMTADRAVDVVVEWTPRVTFGTKTDESWGGTTIGPTIKLGWAGPDTLIRDAAEAARKADVAVVFVGHRVGEGMDRMSLDLPNDQDALIEAVAAANPRTIVMLQTGGAVTMPWLSRVAAVMEMWLPGDGFGEAAARLLFGDSDPGGRLPVTFPMNEGQGPGQDIDEYPGRGEGGAHEVHYAEDLLIGYRYWDAKKQDPLFPFGHGLSYATFDMGACQVRRVAGNGVDIEVPVRNIGKRAGSEVVQVYVGFPVSAGAAPKQLKGMQKVWLDPGEARAVRVHLDEASFQYWGGPDRRWTTDPGQYTIMIGNSSRDIRCEHGLELAGSE